MRRVRVVLLGVIALAALPAAVAFAQYPQPAGVCSAVPATLDVQPNSVINFIVTALTTDGKPAVGVQGTATLTGQPGAGAQVLTPNFTTNSQGQATIQIQTGDTPGNLAIALTCGALSSSSVVKVSAPGQVIVPKPPDTGTAGAGAGAGFPILWVALAASATLLTGGATVAVVRRRDS